MPTIRGRNQVEQASGTMPSRPNTKPIRAFVEASRRSIASVIVAPMPTAAPLIAAITGFGSAWIASVTLPPVSRTPSWYGASSRCSRSSSGVGATVSSRPNTLPSAERSMPGAERAPGAGDHDRPHVVVAGVGEEHLLELAGHRQVERVERVRPVQGEGRDAVGVDRPSRGSRRSVTHSLAVPSGCTASW